MEILLVRHAEPVRIVDADGPADPPLHPRGLEQAARLTEYLADEPIDAIFSSPLQRALQTAEPLAASHGHEVVIDDELAEYDRDSTTYIPIEELKASGDERWFAMVEGAYREGVDPEVFARGVVGAVERVIEAHPGGRVLVVCHGGVINTYIGHILGIDRALWFEPRYASVHRVAASRSGVRSIVTINEGPRPS